MAMNLNKFNCVSFAQKGVAGHFSDFVVGCPYFDVYRYDPDTNVNDIGFRVIGHPELMFRSPNNSHLWIYFEKKTIDYISVYSTDETRRFHGMAIGNDDIYILVSDGYDLGGTTSYNNANFKNLATTVRPLKRLVYNFNSIKSSYLYNSYSSLNNTVVIKDLISGNTVIDNSINQSGIDCPDLASLATVDVSANYSFSDNNNSIQLSPWYINGGYYNSEIAVLGGVADSKYIRNIIVGDSQYTLKRVYDGGYICI